MKRQFPSPPPPRPHTGKGTIPKDAKPPKTVGAAGPINPADFATTPVMHLRVTLAEVTRAVIDLEDTRDGLTKAIADLNERAESIRNEIKRLK